MKLLIMMLQLVSFFSILTKVYCENGLSRVKRVPFSHEDAVILDKGFNDHVLSMDKFRGVKIDYRHEDDMIHIKNGVDYCSSFHTCFECVQSSLYPCDWCHNVGCTHIAKVLCPNAVTMKSSKDNILQVCPYIQHSGPILLPSGLRTHISVKLSVPDPDLYDIDIMCQIKLNNRLTHLKGLILKDSIYCYPVKLDAQEYKNAVFGTFRVFWGGYEPYSNKVTITVYNCGGLADECESCRMIDPKFGCGWCDDLNSCVTANQCDDMMNWSMNRLSCNYIKKKMFFV